MNETARRSSVVRPVLTGVQELPPVVDLSSTPPSPTATATVLLSMATARSDVETPEVPFCHVEPLLPEKKTVPPSPTATPR